MALSRVQINARSEAKRGIKSKSFKLHQSAVDKIAQLSKETGISQSRLITEAIDLIAEYYQNQQA